MLQLLLLALEIELDRRSGKTFQQMRKGPETEESMENSNEPRDVDHRFFDQDCCVSEIEGGGSETIFEMQSFQDVVLLTVQALFVHTRFVSVNSCRHFCLHGVLDHSWK